MNFWYIWTMKTLFIILICFSVNSIKAQDFDYSVIPYDSVAQDVVYRLKFNCDTFKKKDIYAASLMSVAELFRSATDVIQYKDEASGKIIVKGIFNVHYTILGEDRTGGYFSFMTSIFIKDGKVKIEINQLIHYGANAQNNVVPNLGEFKNFYNKPRRAFRKFNEQAHSYCELLLTSLKSSILKNLTTSKQEDW